MKRIFRSVMTTLLFGGAFACTNGNNYSIEQLVSRGDIVRTVYNEDVEAGCYIANGRFGAVISPLGLMFSPQEQAQHNVGQSHLSHLGHWGRFQFISTIEHQSTTADYLLPLMKLYWEEQPQHIGTYRQIHKMYDGIVETSFTCNDGTRVEVESWFCQENKNLAGFRVNLSDGEMCIKASTMTGFRPYSFVFGESVGQTTQVEQCGDNYRVTICCPRAANDCRSTLWFYTDVPVEVCDDGLRFVVTKGDHTIYVSYGEPVTRETASVSQQRTREAWHTLWEQSGWFSFPDDNAQKLWVRSMSYLLASYGDFEQKIIQPTNGLSGNVFPFHFVQDMGYIAPALMMTGHNDIVMRWIEKFADEIDEMRDYAKHLWPESEGIYPPWELPFGTIEGYHTPYVPVAYCYEPHNVAYLCRMAREAAEVAANEAWTRQYVHPLVREVCNFYRSAARRGSDGLWHLEWQPSIGQDEAGGRNKSDYLCSLYSAQYAFQTAVEMGLDSDGSLAAILRDGMAFESLLSERGTYHTAHGADDFGRQKHPVQLDGLAYFPLTPAPLAPESKAYELRYEICEGAHKPHFAGWTLGEFLLAGSNIRSVEGWRTDWAAIRPSDYTDSEWIQLYETSGNRGASFYVTTHGMILQSLIRNYVNDYWGVLDLAACPVFDGDVSFGNIITRSGVTVSGRVSNGRANVELRATRDCKVVLRGETFSLKQGQTKQIKIQL